MSKPDWKYIARQLNEHLAEGRLSTRDVANKAGVDRKTVDRLRQGRAVRAQTLQWIEQALKTEFGHPDDTVDVTAAARFGGYRRDTVEAYIGTYLAFRRSFDTVERIIASYLEIIWDETLGALSFAESQDNRLASGRAYAYRFGGEILIPPNLGVMNFVVCSNDGRVRLISTAMPREEDGSLYMKGFILTLNELRDIGYYPVTSPIFLVRGTADRQLETGVIEKDDPRYGWAQAILQDIEINFLPQSR
jgi:transcriptional regulator with XRE-family HTH domain